MPNVLANGVSLYYEEHGAGEPIVCIHGTLSSAGLWREAAAELGTRAHDRVRPPRVLPQRAPGAVCRGCAPACGRCGGVDRRARGGARDRDRAQRRRRDRGRLALRYPNRVQALALLEGGGLTLGEAARRWIADVDEQVFAAAEADMSTVAETLFRAVAGDAGWDGLPETVKEELMANGAAIVTDERSGYLDVSAEQLGTIVQPTLLVAAKDSPPEFAEVTSLMAKAMPSARVE